MKFDDIIIRKLLQVSKFHLENINKHKYYENSNICFFYICDTKLVIGYYIKTIIGLYEIPVISWSHIRKKKQLGIDFFETHTKLKLLWKKKWFKFFLSHTSLPVEIIEKICSFY